MTDLNAIISTFSKEEQGQFISYLEKKNKRSDAKNIILFKLLVTNTLSSNELCFKLYQTNKQNAYHALRKRLYQSLIEFIANSNLEEENSEDMQIIKYILASRNFLLHKHYNLAYKILDKAETLAEEHYLFPLLNEIYHTKIQYAYLNPQVDIESLTKKYQANQKKHYLEDQLNIVYAKIRQTLHNINHKDDIVNFENILDHTLKEHNITLQDSLSFKSLYQLMTIVSLSAFVTNDYLRIEQFIIDAYKSIQSHNYRGKQLYYHIQVVYMLSNTLFRNKKFDKSMLYLEKMYDQMQLNKAKYHKTFILKYKLLLALNYNYSNQQDKAIATLEPLIVSKHRDTEALLDIHLSLITYYFQKGDFKKAHGIFSKFHHTDKWYAQKTGIEWVIKKNLIEILLHIELGNIDLVDSRILSFKRSHFNYLKSIDQGRAITYLQLIESLYKHPELARQSKFRDQVKTSFKWVDPIQEDIFVMSFYAWLKSKIDNKPLYITTLDTISEVQNVNS